mmetsp:Transcript_29278/g.52390  ORF Transcript_29278/g.52390 Transcript_29278/m.52390 type:complete len:608 (-) Transcript_29278:2357-4180(-)
MSNFFRSVAVLKPEQLVKAYYLSVSKLTADHKGIELGIGNETLFKAVAKATGLSEKQVKQQTNTLGDLGEVASTGKDKQKNLTSFFTKKAKIEAHSVDGVYDTFMRVANCHGQNSATIKEGYLVKLFNTADSLEVKYLIRIAQKSLKIGASELTMQSALAKAIAVTPPNQTYPHAVLKDRGYETKVDQIEELVKQAISECPDYDIIIPTLLKYDGSDLTFISRECHITPGVPVKPMLAKPSKGLEEVLKRFTGVGFTCEYKYDGMRAQIHLLQDGSVKLFSRNAEDFTEAYPDLVAFLGSHIDRTVVQECIIDTEIVAFDLETQRIRPFQDIQTRGRKNVELVDIKVQVCIFPFDILYLNGISCLKETLQVRRDIFFRHFTESPGKFEFVQHRDMETFEDIETLLVDSVKVGCEGLMIKTLTQAAQYEPSKRSFSWLKLKKDYLEENSLGDSVDLVPIGAFYGTGKRTGLYGSFLLAVYNEGAEEFQTVCKIGTGFSDEILLQFYNQLKETVIPKPRRDYRHLFPDIDVWFEPTQVWEVRAADLSISPVHTASYSKAAEGKGIGLRFPRFIKVRPDKAPEQSTSADQIYEMYSSQSSITTNWEDDLI